MQARQRNFVLGLAASPRLQANSTILLDTVLAAAAEQGCRVQKLEIFKFDIRPCKGCGGCDKTGVCVINDDMHSFDALIQQAGHIILAAPIYFYALSGIAKAFIDRSQAQWVRKYFLKEQIPATGKGYLIATGATRGKRLFECSSLTMRYYCDALNLDYSGDLLVRGVENEGDVLKDSAAMEKAKELGRTIGRGGEPA